MSIRFDNKRFNLALKRLPQVAVQVSRQVLAKGGELYRSHLADSRLSGRPGLKRVSGELLRRTSRAVTVTPTSSTLSFVFGVPYARIHEKGGDIVPKRKQWLTIPTAEAKTAKGITSGPARSFKNLRFVLVSPVLALLVSDGKPKQNNTPNQSRKFPESKPKLPKQFILKPRKPRTSSTSKLLKPGERVVFVLKKRVTIPPRLGFGKSWREFWLQGRGKSLIQEGRAEIMRRFQNGV